MRRRVLQMYGTHLRSEHVLHDVFVLHRGRLPLRGGGGGDGDGGGHQRLLLLRLVLLAEERHREAGSSSQSVLFSLQLTHMRQRHYDGWITTRSRGTAAQPDSVGRSEPRRPTTTMCESGHSRGQVEVRRRVLGRLIPFLTLVFLLE